MGLLAEAAPLGLAPAHTSVLAFPLEGCPFQKTASVGSLTAAEEGLPSGRGAGRSAGIRTRTQASPSCQITSLTEVFSSSEPFSPTFFLRI